MTIACAKNFRLARRDPRSPLRDCNLFQKITACKIDAASAAADIVATARMLQKTNSRAHLFEQPCNNMLLGRGRSRTKHALPPHFKEQQWALQFKQK
jgi:hypothetical protein